MMGLPQEMRTQRLYLRRPKPADADAIFSRYATDPEATRYLGWPRHRTLRQTEAFLEFSDREWSTKPGGPYLVFSPMGQLLGGTGLEFETEYRVVSGFVFAKDAWGRGYATEVMKTMLSLAFAQPTVQRLYALCHVEHLASARVLEKAGLRREGTLRRYLLFPNLPATLPSDVFCYAALR
jgi:RimJ/RimL family protein N-acetyltransferase